MHSKLFYEEGWQAGLARRMAKYMLETWHYYYLNTTAVHYWDISDSADLYLLQDKSYHNVPSRLNGMGDYVAAADYANLPRCLISYAGSCENYISHPICFVEFLRYMVLGAEQAAKAHIWSCLIGTRSRSP